MVHEGYVYFSEENTETVLENVVENDYTDTAGDAVAIAEEKAKKRKESRMKYEEQEKRKKGSMSLFSN